MLGIMILLSFLLCLLSTTSAAAVDQASVQEVPQPSMTVEHASPLHHAAYYAFNKGEPFLVERDPHTGAIDFNKKSTPKSVDNVESNTASNIESDGDYFYDEETEGDGIDRKDGSIQGNIYRPNDIQNPYKISPDLHQFLSLPVHYSSSDKFPLISNSYANTKVQGTGGSSSSYSNHKYVTSTTQSPSYYTMPTTKYTTAKPQTQPTTLKTTTSRPTTKPTTTTTEADEYDIEYNEYEGEDSDPLLDNQAVPSEYHTSKPDLTKYTVTTYRPTTYNITTSLKPTTMNPSTEKTKQEVSIVTSLPLDVYYSTSQDTTIALKNSTTTSIPASTTSETSILDLFNAIEQVSNETHRKNTTSHLSPPNEEFYSGFGQEPFRPIYGSSETSTQSGANNQILHSGNEFSKPPVVNEFQRLPPYQNVPYIKRPTLPPQMEPPRLDAPQSSYSPDQVKTVPGQHHASISFGDMTKLNTKRPVHESVYERPPPPLPYNKDTNNRFEYQPQSPVNSPTFEGIASERPIQSVKPRPALEVPVQSNFKMPSKVENHFIKVSPGQENPSYSLQTSFSIGVPASPEANKLEVRPGQGVGQVLFPDDTPAESSPAETNVHLPSPVLRPPGNGVPIQGYQPNRQPVRAPPTHIRLPSDDHPPPAQLDTYPRPHWENHAKPLYSSHNSIPKKDIVLPQYYPGLSKGKPENIQRPDLPNILPQFRPNAKVGHDYHTFNPSGERLREPFDTLQPPPLPRPQHLRINRNDEETEIERVLTPGETKVDPLVHRRSGPQPGRVTTLQMMKQNSQRKNPESKPVTDSEKPVFLVYPTAHGMNHHRSPPEGSVVIGTRAQRPLPPANLEKEKDDLDTFPLDDNKQFPIPGRDRVDTPILKTKNPNKHLVKNEFPYAIVKPHSNDIPEERILSSSSNMKEYNAFSPTPQSSTEETKDHEAEINIIPYLQDYMPFATKRPLSAPKPLNSKKDPNSPQKPQVISTTLDTSLATERSPIENVDKKTQEVQEKNGSEMTVSATMYTQQRPATPNHRVPVTYTPSEPQPVGFQAPFMASLSEPQNGWNVVTDKNFQPASEPEMETSDTDAEGNKFDIEHFQPQLFGGFKPILQSSDEESTNSKDKDKDVLPNKGDREEKAL